MTASVKYRWLGGVLAAGAMTLGAIALTPEGATAAAPPFGASTVNITAREEPIGAFLQDLFSQAGLTVVLSPDLKGTVNGAFTGPASRVYGGITRAFNLLTYYDGVAVYVYPSAEVSTRAVNADVADAPKIEASLRSLGLPDTQNQVRVSNRMLVATGSRRFLDQVDEIAHSNGPTAGEAGGYGARSAPPARAAALQYRVYYLRYAWAEDVTVTFSGRQVTLPGVASILRTLMTEGNGGAPLAQRTETASSSAMGGLKGQGLNPNAGRDLGHPGLHGQREHAPGAECRRLERDRGIRRRRVRRRPRRRRRLARRLDPRGGRQPAERGHHP